MEPAGNDESINLLGEALQNLMASEDGQSDELIPAGDTMEFHHYMDLPFRIREMIRDDAIDQERIMVPSGQCDWYYTYISNHNIARLTPVSREWQWHTERHLFEMIRIDPLDEEEVREFKELFKENRRELLMRLDIIIDDRPTSPWHMAGGMLQISQAMGKVGQFFRYPNLWDSEEPEDRELWYQEIGNSWDFGELRGLEINFVSLDLGFLEMRSARQGERSMKTSSLWTESQLKLLTNSNLATDMPLRAIWSAFPKRFGIVKDVTFSPDCVPFPATIAIMQTMPNLESCSFELSLKRTSEEGMASLTDFVQKLLTLLPSLRELVIRPTDTVSVPTDVTASAYKLCAALRDNSDNLRTLKVEGTFMLQNFFGPFSVDQGLRLAGSEWNWPNLQELNLQFVMLRPFSWPISSPNELSLTPAELLIAGGRAALSMPALRKLRTSACNDWADTPFTCLFSIKRELPRNRKTSGRCRVKLSGLSRAEEQIILSGWMPFMGAKAQFVSEGSIPFDSGDEDSEGDDDDEPSVNLSTTTAYETFPETYRLSTTFGAGALVNNAEFLGAQRLARTKLGIPSHSIPWF